MMQRSYRALLVQAQAGAGCCVMLRVRRMWEPPLRWGLGGPGWMLWLHPWEGSALKKEETKPKDNKLR